MGTEAQRQCFLSESIEPLQAHHGQANGKDQCKKSYDHRFAQVLKYELVSSNVRDSRVQLLFNLLSRVHVERVENEKART